MKVKRLRKLYRKYNKEIFDGILPEDIKIKVKKLNDIWGEFVVEEDVIKIDKRAKKKDAKHTLIHEMVHVLQKYAFPEELDYTNETWEEYDEKIHQGIFEVYRKVIIKTKGFDIR